MAGNAKAAALHRLDTWANALTGLATSRDKTTSTLPYLSPVLAPQALEAMYHDDDIAARIVSAIPDEAYREGFTVISKAAQAAVNEFVDRNPNASDKARRDAPAIAVRWWRPFRAFRPCRRFCGQCRPSPRSRNRLPAVWPSFMA